MTMHPTILLLALGFTLATINAAPLSDVTPTLHPLFTVVSGIPARTASGVVNATAGKFPPHKYSPECEQKYSVNHNSTTDPAHISTTEGNSHATEGKGHSAQPMDHASPHPSLNASSYVRPHAVQVHNHPGCYRSHPPSSNTTATDAACDKTAYSEKINASADSLHTHSGYRCAHPSHRNRTTITRDHDYDKRSVGEIDVTVCFGADCKRPELVTAKVNDVGKLTEIEAKNSQGKVRREDTAFSYEDVARQMSGARIAGGV